MATEPEQLALALAEPTHCMVCACELTALTRGTGSTCFSCSRQRNRDAFAATRDAVYARMPVRRRRR